MPPIGIIFLLAVLLGASGFTVRAFERAQANNRFLPQKQDWAMRRPRLPVHTGSDGTAAVAAAKPPRKKTRGKPATVPRIIVAGVTENWVSRQQHRRSTGHVPLRRRVFHRLVFPGRREKPPAAQIPGPEPVTDPAPSPAKGVPMTETATTTTASSNGRAASGGGGSAGDFFHAQDRMLQEAANGGLKSKVRAHLALGEGFPQQAAALEQYAQHLQDTGQYPSFVWEPVRRAAQFLKSAGAAMAESGSAIASIAKTPAGELQGKAPAREELNKA